MVPMIKTRLAEIQPRMRIFLSEYGFFIIKRPAVFQNSAALSKDTAPQILSINVYMDQKTAESGRIITEIPPLVCR